MASQAVVAALNTGLVSEVVPDGQQLERAVEIARLIAANAPLAVQASLASVRAAERASRDAAAEALLAWNQKVFSSRDAAEGVAAFLERRPPMFDGR